MTDDAPNTPDTTNPDQKPQAADHVAVRRESLFPPLWVWAVVALCALMIAWVRIRVIGGDRATVNVFTLLLGFLAVNAIFLWFLLFSGYTWRFRLFSLIGLASFPVLFLGAFRVEHVSGELVPSFRLRWSRHPDELLERPATATTTEVDLSVTSDRDFPQFLGPDRNASLGGVSLETDWATHPPELLWRQPIGAGWSGFAAVNGYALTLEQRGEEELVTCYEIETGKLVWAHAERARHSTLMGGIGPRSTPTVFEGWVYTLGATGILLCLDGADGSVVWREDLLQRYGVMLKDGEKAEKAVAWGRANSPLVIDGLVVAPAGGPLEGEKVSLAAFNRLTGELVWEAGDRQISYSSPAVATISGKRQILIVNEDSASGHDIEAGNMLWEYPWPGHSNGDASASQPVILPDNRVLLSKGYSGGAALLQFPPSGGGSMEPALGWDNQAALKTKFTNVAVQDGFAYGLSDGILECIDLSDGTRRWKRGRYGHGQVLAVGDSLLVQAESGEVVMVEATPEEFRELHRFQAIEGKTWNNLCLFGDLLLVRNAEEAACYRLRVVWKTSHLD